MADIILVTGAAGFIGSHTCEALLGSGARVIAVDNFNDYYSPQIKEKNISSFSDNSKFRLYKADITDRLKMEEIFKKESVKKVIHLAARAGVRPSLEDPQLYSQVNITGTINLLEAARKTGVTHFVFGSSSSVYGENQKIPFHEEDQLLHMVSPYAVTKRSGELMCSAYHRLYHMNITSLRFFTVYGPRGRPDMAPYIFTKNIMEGKPINKFGDGTTKRDYTFISDIVSGIISALGQNGFEIINLGNNNPISLNEFIGIIETITGKEAIINQKPMQKGDVPITYADIGKAQQMLGYSPQVTLKEGLAQFYDWLKFSA